MSVLNRYISVGLVQSELVGLDTDSLLCQTPTDSLERGSLHSVIELSVIFINPAFNGT